MTEKKILKEEDLNKVAGGEGLVVVGYQCNRCSFSSEDEETMKKHMHDVHELIAFACHYDYAPFFDLEK